jgi:hypothetical protein
MRNVYKILIENPEGKRPLVKPRSTWEDNIKTDLTEVVWEEVEWNHLASSSEQC